MKNTPLKNIMIQTITPIYDEVEDRIRLTINYQETQNRIDLMITRSFILKLLPTIEEYTYNHYPSTIEEDLSIQVENNATSNDKIENNNNLEKTNMEDLALFQSTEDLLLTIHLRYDQNTTNTTLEFVSKKNHKASIMCDVKTLQNINNSIKNVLPKMSWGISEYF